jgi:hypothetical protein
VSTPERNIRRVEEAKREGYRHSPLPETPDHCLDKLNDPRDEALHRAMLRLHGVVEE